MIGTNQYANIVESTEGEGDGTSSRAVETANSFVDLQVPTSGLVSPGPQSAGNVTFLRIKSDRTSR